jgi:hypothetical protein
MYIRISVLQIGVLLQFLRTILPVDVYSQAAALDFFVVYVDSIQNHTADRSPFMVITL